MPVTTLFFSAQFHSQIRDGRVFHTFRRRARPGEIDLATVRSGDPVRLVFDLPRLGAMDVTVADVAPMRIGRHPLSEGGIAGMTCRNQEFRRRDIEITAFLLGFGLDDRSGATARIRMGHFYRHVFPGDGPIIGHVLSWHPPGGAERARQVLAMAEAAADLAREVHK